jgi:hypothetical protein
MDLSFIVPLLALFTLLAVAVFALMSKKRVEEAPPRSERPEIDARRGRTGHPPLSGEGATRRGAARAAPFAVEVYQGKVAATGGNAGELAGHSRPVGGRWYARA